MDQSEEIKRIIEEATSGNFLPLAIVAAVFSVVILLLLYIWNKTQNDNEKRHESHEEMLKTLVESNQEQKLINQRLEIMVNVHERELEDLKNAG